MKHRYFGKLTKEECMKKSVTNIFEEMGNDAKRAIMRKHWNNFRKVYNAIARQCKTKEEKGGFKLYFECEVVHVEELSLNDNSVNMLFG